MANIPKTNPASAILSPYFISPDFEDGPYKIIYASDGISWKNIAKHINEYYRKNSHIPLNRRPNIIHVSGKYAVMRAMEGVILTGMVSITGTQPDTGDFIPVEIKPDIQAIIWVKDELQKKAIKQTK